MPISSKYLAEFSENNIYHVYNRTNNNDLLFIDDDNYFFFLEKYNHYLSPILNTFCWNLLPNHFHLMIKIKPESSIISYISSKLSNEQTKTEQLFLLNKTTLSDLVVKTFTRFFQSYAQSFNKIYSREGNLFYRPFKRIEILKESQFISTMIYIHANALKHGLTKDFTLHKWSSWHSFLSLKPTKLLRNETFDWFGNKEVFIKTHFDLANFYYDDLTGIED